MPDNTLKHCIHSIKTNDIFSHVPHWTGDHDIKYLDTCIWWTDPLCLWNTNIKGTSLRSGRVNHILLPTYLGYQNVYVSTSECPLLIWQFGLNMKCICCNAFPRSIDIIQINELPTDWRHMKVPQERVLCPTHVDNKKIQVFENNLLSVFPIQL